MRTYLDEELTFPAVPAAGGADSGTIRVTASSELMEDFAASRAVDGGQRQSLAAVADSDGNLITFSIAEDKALGAIVRAPSAGGPAIWRYVDLTSRLRQGDSGGEVKAFGVGQAMDGTYTVAVALAGGGGTRVYVAAHVTDNPARADWSAFPWRLRAETDWTVDRVLVGRDDIRVDGEGEGPLVVVVLEKGGTALVQRVSLNRAQEPAGLVPVHLPVNAARVRALAIGATLDGVGLYVLSENEGRLSLAFVTVGQEEEDVLSLDPAPEGAALLEVLDELPPDDSTLGGRPRRTGLYVAGKGVWYLPASEQVVGAMGSGPEGGRNYRQLAAPAAVPSARSLWARQDDERVAVWVVDGQQRLQSIAAGSEEAGTGEVGASVPGKWFPPIVLRSGVREMCPIRNAVRSTNDLCVLDTTMMLTHLQQDPGSSIWRSQEFPVPDTGKVQSFLAHRSQLVVTKEDGQRVERVDQVELRASEWCEAVVNGKGCTLDPHVGLPVKLDGSGGVSVTVRAGAAPPPIFRLTVGDRVVTANPSAKLDDRLGKIVSGRDLELLRRQDGTPLIDVGRFPDKERSLNDAAASLSLVRSAASRLPRDGSTSDSYLSPEDLAFQPGYWVFDIADDGGLTFLRGDEALAAMQEAPSDIWEGLRRLAGDVLQWVEQAAGAAARFAVRIFEGALEIAVSIGNEIQRFVVKCLTQAYGLTRLFLQKALGVDLDAIFQWLGFLFDWKDIVVTHRVLANVAKQVVTRAAGSVGVVRDHVDEFFARLVEEVRRIGPVPADVPARDVPIGRQVAEARGRRTEKERAVEECMQGPGGGFAFYHLQHSVQLPRGGGAVAGVLPTSETESAEIGQLLDAIAKFAQEVRDDLMELYELVKSKVASGDVTPNGLWELILHAVSKGGSRLLSVVRKIVGAVLDFVDLLVRKATALVTDKVEIPFLSAFYRRLTGDDMSVLSGIALLLAAPITIGYKIVAGEAPFPFVDTSTTEDAAALEGLSSDPAYADSASKPRTWNLETLGAVALWAFLSTGAGAAATLVLYKFDRFAQGAIGSWFVRMTAARAWGLTTAVFGVALFVWRLATWIVSWVMLGLPKTPGEPDAVGTIRRLRTTERAVLVLGGFISIFDAAGVVAGSVDVAYEVLDVLLALPMAVLRIGPAAAAGDGAAVGAYLLEFLTTCVELLTTVVALLACLMEGVGRAIATGVAYGLTAVTGITRLIAGVLPIVLNRMFEPVG